MSNVPNWTYKENKDGVKQLLFKGRVATRKGTRRGVRGGAKGHKRVTLPGNVNSKGGRVSYTALRNKAKNLGLPVVSVEKRTQAVKELLAKFKATPPPSHRLTREELVNAILSKNLPKFVPKERKERSNKGKARKSNEEKAATKKARANRAKAKRATLSKAKKTLGARMNLAKRLKAAAEKAKAANAAAAAANAEVVNLQAQVARQAKRKAVEETNANKNRAVKRVKVARQLKKLGLSQSNINNRLRERGLL